MSTKHHTAWLVYEERDVYDGGGIAPLLVAESETLAAQAKADIERAIELVRRRLDRMPNPDDQGLSDDEWSYRFEARNKMLERVRWPHRIKRHAWAWDFTVSVMPLNFARGKR